jgi:hypothetical protein
MVNLVYEQPDMPSLKSKFMATLARELMHKLDGWKTARQPLERQWMENDRAYLCQQRLPEMEGMQYIYAGRTGETDIFDGVNNLSLRLSLASMPKDESWLTVVGRMGESAQLINATQAQQIWMHRKAGTRKVVGRHYKQLIVRGTSYYYLRWHTETKYKRLGTVSGRRRLRRFLQQNGQDESIVKQVNSIRQSVIEFQGPAPRVLDSYDVWMDPEADLVCDRRPGMVIVTYMRPCDIAAAKDEDGEDMFENYDKIVPHKGHEVYWGSQEGNRRLQSLNMLGIRPQNYASSSTDLVPVYTFYCHYMEHQGVKFYDTYFHVADDKQGDPRIIRIEENPSNDGHRLILQDQFIEFFTNVAYGISGVEKLLAAWHQKNFLSALMLNAAAATTFPAYLVASGLLKDEMPNLTPGAINEIAAAALQLDNIIRPMPVPERGLQLSFNEMDYYKKKIGGGFEVTGAYASDSGQSLSTRETATSVNFRATNQGLAIDELSEKFGDNIQNLCQWAYDMNQQTAVPERNAAGEKVIQFGQIDGNSVRPGELKFDEWKQPRSIEVLGLHGVANKDQAIKNKMTALQHVVPAAQILPNTPALTTKLLRSLFTDLNVETDDQDWMTPQQLAAGDPAVQMAALEQAIQNPDILQMAMQSVAQQQGMMPNDQAQAGPTPTPSPA